MRIVNLIGVGPGNPDMLTKRAVDAISASDVVMGATRALNTARAALPTEGGPELLETFRTEEMVEYILAHPEKKTISAVFTGDTSVYSGAIPLRRALKKHMAEVHDENYEDDRMLEQLEIRNYAGVSSIQYFLSKRSISMADVKLVSLHGLH